MLEEIGGSDVDFIEDELGNRGRFWKEQEEENWGFVSVGSAPTVPEPEVCGSSS